MLISLNQLRRYFRRALCHYVVGQFLNEDGGRAPVTVAIQVGMDFQGGRNLLRLAEIVHYRACQAVVLKLHNALIAVEIRALVDGKCDIAAAEQLQRRGVVCQSAGCIRIEADISPDLAFAGDVGNQRFYWPGIAAHLQGKDAVIEFKGRSQDRGKRQGIAQHAGNGAGIGMPL